MKLDVQIGADWIQQTLKDNKYYAFFRIGSNEKVGNTFLGKDVMEHIPTEGGPYKIQRIKNNIGLHNSPKET